MNTQIARRGDTELDSERTAPAVFQPPRLPYHPEIGNRFGIDRGTWKVLTDAIFPSAQDPSSIVLALSYCQSRKLDVLKKPVHIVPMKQKRTDSKGRTEWIDVDTIWPGISELRTTAMRTGDYAGKDATVFGKTIEQTFKGKVQEWEGPPSSRQKVERDKELTVRFPEWAEVTVYRMVSGVRCAFVGPKVYWLEQYATISRYSDLPNEMWADRAFGQIDKCAEAAALRCAFPEEIGNQLTAEEMEGRRLHNDAATAARDVTPQRLKAPPPNSNGNGAGVVEQPKEPPEQDNVVEAEVTQVAEKRRAPPPPQQQRQAPQASGEIPKDKSYFLDWVKTKLSECTDADAVMLAWTDDIYENIPNDLHDAANEILQVRLAEVGGEP